MLGPTPASVAGLSSCYEAYLEERLLEETFLANFLKLEGLELVCFCAGPEGLSIDDPLKCHAQVVGRVLRRLLEARSNVLLKCFTGEGIS